MSQELSIFTFESREIRFVGTAEAPEWVAADILTVLYPEADSRNYRNYLCKIADEWKGHKKIMTPGGTQNIVTVLEPGLYALIGRSNSPLAVPFQKWLYEEVIPSIRKTGAYTAPNAPTPEPVARQPRPSKPASLAAIREGLNMLHQLRELQELGTIDESTKIALKDAILESLSDANNDVIDIPSKNAAPAPTWTASSSVWKDSLPDFFEKVKILLSEGKIGDWNCREVKKVSDNPSRVYAFNLTSIWDALEKRFTVPYNLKIIKSLLIERGATYRRQMFRVNSQAADKKLFWCYELSEELLREYS
jgi:prophage antirepressor-like protein